MTMTPQDFVSKWKRADARERQSVQEHFIDLRQYKCLDEAVFAAYGWSPNLTDEEILEKLLALNLQRSQA
jgi:hypothetical protein